MAQMRLENLKTRSPQYRKIRSHGTEKTGRHCKTMNSVVSMSIQRRSPFPILASDL